MSQYNGFGINGESTLNNNFADLGGLYIMEQLLLQSNTSEIRIPGLNQWSKEQLFYIQYARMKCSKSTIQQEEKVRVIHSFVLMMISNDLIKKFSTRSN